ncbi:MAG: transcription-repair coupling factor, partial [Spirochaetaceae bacterium]|nr:transcription-repair coupling factor [Spirochaetaceae bacterium]
MITLRPQAMLERLRSHSPIASFLSKAARGPYPVDVAEAEGPFAALLVAEAAASRRGPVLVVVPTDQEAQAMESDLSLLGADPILMPWWRTAAYRAASARAHAFGERSACLARMALGSSRVVVACQRAFVTPVPPRAYFEPLVFSLSRGGSIDPAAVGERLAQIGYLRVPRVSLPGEFALRGEVLDIFLPGDESAVRAVFEYDRIERLSSFDPVLQSSSGALDSVAVRPMKETIWDRERVDTLAAALPRMPGLRGREGPLLEELAEKGEARGEELWYPLAFEKPGTLLDYLGEDALVFLHDHERLGAQEEAARKEFAGLYRRALQEGPVPPPDKLLHSFAALEADALSGLGGKRKSFALARSFALKDAEAIDRLRMGAEQPRSFFGNVQYFKEEVATLTKTGYDIV